MGDPRNHFSRNTACFTLTPASSTRSGVASACSARGVSSDGSIAGRTIRRYTPAASASRPAIPTNSVLLIDHLPELPPNAPLSNSWLRGRGSYNAARAEVPVRRWRRYGGAIGAGCFDETTELIVRRRMREFSRTSVFRPTRRRRGSDREPAPRRVTRVPGCPRRARRDPAARRTLAVADSSLHPHRIHSVRPRKTLQQHLPGCVEPNVAGGLRQFTHQRRHQNLPTGRRSRDTRGQDDALAVEVVAFTYGLACV